MKLNQYPKYKKSEIPWVGPVPDDWIVNRAKWYLKSPKELNSNEQCNKVLSLTLRGVVDNDPENPEGMVPKDYKTYQIFEKDNLVFKLIDLENIRTSRVGLVDKKGIMSSAYIRVEVGKEYCSDFFYYLYYSWYLQNIYNKLGAGVRATLSSKDLLDIRIPLPSLKEQKMIACFIHAKDRKIAKFIRNKRRLIELFKEQKQAIINQAVTQGITPNVKMKASGINWIDYVPKHWKVLRLKTFADVVLGKMLKSSPSKGDELKPYLRSANIQWFKPDITDIAKMWFSKSGMKKYLLKSEDILVSEGGEVGRACIWNDELEECYIQNSVHKITPNKKILSSYLLYQFSTYASKGAFVSIVNRVSIGHLTREKLVTISFFNPPIDEQKKTVFFIKKRSEKIQSAIEKAEKEIKLIQEYRTRLISDVVTGKVDVRNIKIDDITNEESADDLTSPEEIEEFEDSVEEGVKR